MDAVIESNFNMGVTLPSSLVFPPTNKNTIYNDLQKVTALNRTATLLEKKDSSANNCINLKRYELNANNDKRTVSNEKTVHPQSQLIHREEEQQRSKIQKDEDDVRSHMEKIRKVVTWNDQVNTVVGHTRVKAALDAAFIMANCLEYPLDSSVLCTHVLIAGLGGLGKTELMKAAAVKASKMIKKPISVFNVKAADLLSKYIGDSEKAINALWDVIERYAPSLVIFDEVDGLMKARAEGESDAMRRFKTTLLSELRGNRQLKNVVVVAATNKANDLDDNFLSRFRLRYVVKPPTPAERKMLFEKFFRVCELAMKIDLQSIDYDLLLENTNGFSGNDIATVVGLSASYSLRLQHKGRAYAVEEIDCIRDEIENVNIPAKATLLPLTMDTLLKAIRQVKPSCGAMDMKQLNKWAQKWCKDVESSEEKEVFQQESCGIADFDCCCTSCIPF